MIDLLHQFKSVKTFVFDVDGVLTDGSVLLLESGLQARQMNVKDGLALQMAVRSGYRVVILSGGTSEPVIRRFQYLGIDEVHLGVTDKLRFMELFLVQQGLQWNEILCIGDDLPDMPVLQKAGLSCCPADAAMEVQQIVHYISPFKGGGGCVRDVIEKVLRPNGHWQHHSEISSR